MRAAHSGGRTPGWLRWIVASTGIVLGLIAAPGAQTPLHDEEVSFTNGDIRLAGTLTLPASGKPRAATVLLTGSGAQNRDEELFGFRPFRVIADHLSRNGIAVLRYDDRGVGGSTGSVATATTHDFARDALAALAFVKARLGAPTPVGLLGHSEGAIAAAIAASESTDVAFVVWLAGPAERGDVVLRRQAEDLSKAAGANGELLATILTAHRALTDAIRDGADRAEVVRATGVLVRAQLELMPAQKQALGDVDAAVARMAEANATAMLSPWFRAFIALDPAESLSKVRCPLFAVFGERDMQVPPTANRPVVEAALARGGNRRSAFKEYPDANHLFIKSATGHPSEYPTLDKTFVTGLLDDITSWIGAQLRP